jgi:hypothetical protein
MRALAVERGSPAVRARTAGGWGRRKEKRVAARGGEEKKAGAEIFAGYRVGRVSKKIPGPGCVSAYRLLKVGRRERNAEQIARAEGRGSTYGLFDTGSRD